MHLTTIFEIFFSRILDSTELFSFVKQCGNVDPLQNENKKCHKKKGGLANGKIRDFAGKRS